MRYTKAKLIADAKWYGLQVYTYSPGDGVTRYRFVLEGADGGYFGGSDIGTALGIQQAKLWLAGYAVGCGGVRWNADTTD
jgi:hypothetical protein